MSRPRIPRRSVGSALAMLLCVAVMVSTVVLGVSAALVGLVELFTMGAP